MKAIGIYSAIHSLLLVIYNYTYDVWCIIVFHIYCATTEWLAPGQALDMKQDLCPSEPHSLGSRGRGTRTAQLSSAVREASPGLAQHRELGLGSHTKSFLEEVAPGPASVTQVCS